MPFRPPFLLPFDSLGAPPPMVTTTVNTDGWQDQTQDPIAAAGALVDGYGTQIRQFVNNQRLQVQLGGDSTMVHKRSMNFGGDVHVHYMNHFGQERIQYYVYPKNLPPMMTTSQNAPPIESPKIPLVALLGSSCIAGDDNGNVYFAHKPDVWDMVNVTAVVDGIGAAYFDTLSDAYYVLYGPNNTLISKGIETDLTKWVSVPTLPPTAFEGGLNGSSTINFPDPTNPTLYPELQAYSTTINGWGGTYVAIAEIYATTANSYQVQGTQNTSFISALAPGQLVIAESIVTSPSFYSGQFAAQNAYNAGLIPPGPVILTQTQWAATNPVDPITGLPIPNTTDNYIEYLLQYVWPNINSLFPYQVQEPNQVVLVSGGGGIIYQAGIGIFTSPDGTTWTQVYNSPPPMPPVIVPPTVMVNPVALPLTSVSALLLNGIIIQAYTWYYTTAAGGSVTPYPTPSPDCIAGGDHDPAVSAMPGAIAMAAGKPLPPDDTPINIQEQVNAGELTITTDLTIYPIEGATGSVDVSDDG